MRRSPVKIKAAAILITASLIIIMASRYITANDTPHNASNNISCGDCHGAALLNSPFWGGTMSYDQLCLNCHRVSSGPYMETNAPLVKTHSSLTTSNKYGDWTRECRDCHDPHYQRQKNYKTSDASNLYLATGTITSSPPPSYNPTENKTTLYYSSITYKPGWDVTKLTNKTGDNRRTILFPNVNKLGYNYPVIAVDTGAKTITVSGNATTYLYPPTTFAATYGQYVKDIMNVSGTDKTAKFFDQTGTSSFADGDSTYNGVCEVCHTTTIFHTNIGDGTNHFDAQNCTTCHPHIEGFKPSCKGCHGYPPPSLATLGAGPTGSTTPGAHVLHVTTKGYQCSICHYNSAGSGATHNNNIITLGFVSLLGAYTGGSYDGQTTANYQSSDAGTTVSKTGNKQCSNIYCHGGTMAPNGGTASAIWDNPSSAVCGTCHGASTSSPPLKGSHLKHAGLGLQLPCSDCHNGYVPSTIPSGMATHVNNEANFAFDKSKNYIATASYNGTTTMLDAYGYCSSTYCHGSGTPQWGAISTNADCTWCHGGNAASAVPITLVNHPAHMNQASVLGTNYECAQCHSTTVSAGNDRLITGAAHANGTKDVSMLMGGTWTAGTAICSSVYCHSSGKGTYVNPPAWGSSTNLGCNGCHGTSNAIGWPDYANEGAGLPNANSHISHVTTSADCNTCHTNTTTTGTVIKTGSILHTNRTLDVTFDTTKAGGSATWTAGIKTCSNISCHGSGTPQWGATLSCLDCHSGSLNDRADIKSQFVGNSHHVQGVTLTNTHCYQCHWEANSDGTINHAYHGGSGASGSPVDLVIYGAGTRPTTYTSGSTAVQYTANGSRSEIGKLNTHCLSCHSAQNNSITPFGDGKTPKQYAWDGASIDEKYSQTGTTTWGKYTTTANAAQKNVTKAYSAHGNATSNGGGRSSTYGVDETIQNTRAGSENIACFDCHNSHGSSVLGTTTSYTSATTNGGILKDTAAGKGGYSMTYKPQVGGSTADKDAYNAGAGLCFDCHMTTTAGTTPWGYQSTFGATQAIMGYWDTPYFGPGTFASTQRFGYKITSHKGGHFGASSPISGWPSPTPIRGLCTPCHDPHGISPTLGTNMQYGVPLLKGTWLTSPYKEDSAPVDTRRGTIQREGIHYHIDQNTFGSDIKDADPPVQGIQESDTQFAGLCLNCHSKIRLTGGSHTWKSKDRVHESVKGWKTADTTIQHNYSCSKCHTAHNSRLPRLMVTNCLNYTHKGYMGNNTSPLLQGHGHGEDSPVVCSGQGTSIGYCPEGVLHPRKSPGSYSNRYGSGGGHIPGSWGGQLPDYDGFAHTVTCHENNASDQSWNTKTPWSEDYTPEITSGPFASLYAEGTNIKANITWTTRNPSTSTSYVDYGLTDSYGSTTEDPALVKDHSVILTNLTNHSTYHYRVRSNGITTGDYIFITSFPPTVPSPLAVPATTCYEPCDITLRWNPSTDPDSGPVQYYVEVDDASDFSSPNYTSGWITGTSWTVTLPPGNWCWRVRARDGNHTEAVSDWSSSCFNTVLPPPAPTLIPEPDVVSSGPASVTLEWNPVTCPDGHPVEYLVEVNDTSWWFSNPKYTSGWISGTSWTVTLPTAKTWYWKVQARDAVHPHSVSYWSTADSFIILSSNPPPAPTLIDEPDIVVISTPTSVTFEWNSVACPDSDPVEYNVQWSTSPSFTFPAPQSSGWISGMSWTTSLNSGTWYWRVQARDKNHTDATSPYSIVDSFVISLQPPPAPTLIDEPDIISAVPTSVTLEWNSVTCPDGHNTNYYVEVDDASDFSSPNYTSGVIWLTGTSWSVTVDPDKTWYWRVQARDSYFLHTSSVSPWSTPDSFNVFLHNPPPAPTLWGEPDIVTTEPTPVTLQWWAVTSPDGNPVEYYVEVDDDPNFGSINYSSGWVSGTSWTVTLPPGYWCWRVKARDNAHNISIVSSWSTSDCFNTMPPPSTPILIPEPDILSSGPASVTLEWNPVICPDGDPVQYQVQVSQVSYFFPTDYVSGWISGTSWTVTLPTAKTWYWKVQARDAVHTQTVSSWSTVDSFIILSSNPPPAPTLIDEPDIVVPSVPASVTLQWNSVADPDGDPVEYNVQWSTSPSFTFPAPQSSGWISGMSWTTSLNSGTWYWRVQARDKNHTDATSPYSTVDSFVISLEAPPAPTLIDEPDVISAVPVSVTLQWNSVTCPDGHTANYYVEVDDTSDFSSPNYTSGVTWLTGTSWSVTVDPDKTWYWRVQARDSYFLHTSSVSPWSTPDSFNVFLHNPPPAPTLWGEPDIVTTEPTPVTLQWWAVTSPDGNPVEYYVEVDDDPNFGSINYSSGWVSGTSWTVTLPPGYWCWRVKARDAVHTLCVSPWSASDCFNTMQLPSAPTLIHEPDVVSPVPVSVTLEWNPVTCPDGHPVEYYVQVDDDQYFGSPNYTSGWVSGISWTVTVDPAKTWYWRVQARDAVHTQTTSPWSTADSFRVLSSNPPPAPTLIHQPDSHTTVPVSVTFNWNSVTDPDGDPVEYNVQVSQYSNFSFVSYTSGWTSGTSWTVTVNAGIRWYWRVQARDKNHTDATSPWSATDSFNTFSADPPPAPTLIHQPDGKVNSPIILEWNSVTCPDGHTPQYNVQVSQYPDFLIANYTSGWITGTNWSVTLPTARTWYWRVQARDGVHTDAVSLWSTADSFNIYQQPPAPTLIDEPNIVSSGPVSVTLEWNSVTCPDGDPVQYYVQVDDASDFSSPDYTSGWTSGTSWSVILPTATTWYWRVQARDSVHTVATSSWSTADSFSIFTVNPPPAPTLIDEPNISIAVPVSVTLDWNSVTCPDGDPAQYYVQVDDAIDFSSPDYTSGWTSGTSWSVILPTATTWYWRVAARDAVHTDATSPWSTADSFVIYGSPAAPTLIDEPDIVSPVPMDVTLDWNAVTSPDGDSAEYSVEVDDASDFSSPNYTSGWITGTNWTVSIPTATTWHWRVQARDAIHTDLISSWSTDSFVIYPLIIDESFEGAGYEESWTETIDGGALDKDSAIPGTPPSGAGSQCLKSVSSTANYKALATRNYGSEQTKTFTSFYLYVETEGLADGDNKPIGALRTSGGSNVFVILLNQNAGQLRIRLRLFYNNGSSYLEDNFNISLNIWYKVEIKYDTTNPGAADAMEWRVNGVSQGGSALSGLAGGYYSGIQQWVCGFLGNQAIAGTVYFDLIRANTLTFY